MEVDRGVVSAGQHRTNDAKVFVPPGKEPSVEAELRSISCSSR